GDAGTVAAAAALPARARAAVEDLLELVPEARGPDDEVSVAALAQAGVRFLEVFAPAPGERAGRARDSLLDRLRELGRTTAASGRRANLARQLLELTSQHTADASAARTGALYVAPLERAGHSGRPHLWVVGLDESRFPGGAVEDPMLLDGERADLAPSLPLVRHRPGERVWHYLRAAGACPGRVDLVANALSLADGREPYPCPLFEDARAQLQATELVHRPVPLAGEALDRGELALASRGAPGYAAWVQATWPHLADGERAAQARRLAAMTRYDGWAGSGEPGAAVWSAARLEMLARCPHRYFLRCVLEAEPLAEEAEDPARWLSPPEAGQLLHEVFGAFMARLARAGERPEPPRHAGLLAALLQAVVARWRDRSPPEHEAAYRTEVARLERTAGIFLSAEAEHLSRHPELAPWAFELEFGTGQAPHPEPAEVALWPQRALRLRGRIDRVDRAGEGVWEIWDYKSGSPRGYGEADLLAGGTVLQWALYAAALPQVLAGRVRRSGYFFPGERGRGLRVAAAPPAPAALAEVLEPLLELAAGGLYPHVQKRGEECRFCEYRTVCAAERLDGPAATEQVAATEQLRALAEQAGRLAQRDAQARSRAAVAGFLETAGVEPADLAPAAGLATLRRWLTAGGGAAAGAADGED
ncbi:MAG: PD-(D/E)XK nuclease family protein, partial [Gemmatimonadota bacterium]